MVVRRTGFAPFSPKPSGAVAEGDQILVIKDATPGTIIHQADEQTSGLKLYISACNTSATAVILTIEWQGDTVTDKVVVCLPPYSGSVAVINSRTMSEAGLYAAYADTLSVVTIYAELRK